MPDQIAAVALPPRPARRRGRNLAVGPRRPPRWTALARVVLAAWLLAALGIAGVGFPAAAQAADAWPVRPIKLVVPYPPGGPLDQVARAMAEAMRASLGQSVVVDNRPGAGGNIGAEVVGKSEPDGYAIVMGAVATHAINPFLYRRMPYDAIADFTPLTRVAVVPNVLVMTPQAMERLAVRSVADLVGAARREPGRLTFGSGGNGSAGHLAGKLLELRAGISLVHVPYKGAAPAKTALLGGEVDLMFDNLASSTPQIRAGQLRALAVTSAARDPKAPEIPTMIESGVADFDIDTWFGLFGPAGLPLAVRDRLTTAATDALGTASVTTVLERLGAAAAPLASERFADFVRAEQRKYRALVEASGATAD